MILNFRRRRQQSSHSASRGPLSSSRRSPRGCRCWSTWPCWSSRPGGRQRGAAPRLGVVRYLQVSLSFVLNAFKLSIVKLDPWERKLINRQFYREFCTVYRIREGLYIKHSNFLFTRIILEIQQT